MPRIYFVNVGANTTHAMRARSPIFPDNSFFFVTFPTDDGSGQSYPLNMRRYIRDVDSRTHLDPAGYAYGDCCQNPRARALLNVQQNDILLFWALLWKIPNREADVFQSRAEDRLWCLIGALRVEHILRNGESIISLNSELRSRAEVNAHVLNGCVQNIRDVRVFLGDPRFSSMLFDHAIDLGIYADNGLANRTIRDRSGRQIHWHERPRWNSVMRSCRVFWDLTKEEEFTRACFVRDAILANNPSFDLLAELR